MSTPAPAETARGSPAGALPAPRGNAGVLALNASAIALLAALAEQIQHEVTHAIAAAARSPAPDRRVLVPWLLAAVAAALIAGLILMPYVPR